MNIRPVVFIEGIFVLFIGIMMLVPSAADLMSENHDYESFLLGSGISILIGGLMIASSFGEDLSLSVRQGFLLTTTSWIVLSAISAMPLSLSSLDISYTDAFFEAMSGLTTTGATVLTSLDTMPSGILLWRSMLQWIGGIGIIVIAVAMLPFIRVGGMQLFRMESSDKSEKILPRASQIASSIAVIYLCFTIICATAYAVAGMTIFEAINHAMTTLSTGGFSTSDQSIGYFNKPSIEWISTLFMFLGGLPFVLYVNGVHGRLRDLATNSQVNVFFLFLVFTILIVSSWLVIHNGVGVFDALRLAAFNIVSVVTTTGYASADYSQWGTFPVIVFFFLTVVGGCTGSTSGGIKIFRFEVMFIALKRQFHLMLNPHIVYISTYNQRPLTYDVVKSVGIFIFQFILILIILTIALCFTGLDFTTSLTGATTAMANVGPGLGEIIGPVGNFSSLSDVAKWLLSFGMLVGRLEILTVIVLFTPSFWSD